MPYTSWGGINRGTALPQEVEEGPHIPPQRNDRGAHGPSHGAPEGAIPSGECEGTNAPLQTYDVCAVYMPESPTHFAGPTLVLGAYHHFKIFRGIGGAKTTGRATGWDETPGGGEGQRPGFARSMWLGGHVWRIVFGFILVQ